MFVKPEMVYDLIRRIQYMIEGLLIWVMFAFIMDDWTYLFKHKVYI